MHRPENLPRSVTELLEGFRPCFTARAFNTFVALVAGLIAAPARRTVCGMLTASAMTGTWHHSRAHRFFASTRWSHVLEDRVEVRPLPTHPSEGLFGEVAQVLVVQGSGRVVVAVIGGQRALDSCEQQFRQFAIRVDGEVVP